METKVNSFREKLVKIVYRNLQDVKDLFVKEKPNIENLLNMGIFLNARKEVFDFIIEEKEKSMKEFFVNIKDDEVSERVGELKSKVTSKNCFNVFLIRYVNYLWENRRDEKGKEILNILLTFY